MKNEGTKKRHTTRPNKERQSKEDKDRDMNAPPLLHSVQQYIAPNYLIPPMIRACGSTKKAHSQCSSINVPLIRIQKALEGLKKGSRTGGVAEVGLHFSATFLH
jgi:hypothetical protein